MTPSADTPPGEVDAAFRLPPLATYAHPSSSSTALPPWTLGCESQRTTSFGAAPPLPALASKSLQICKRPEGTALTVRPGRKWLLEPVLTTGEAQERWVRPRGAPPAPPRRRAPTANETLALAEAAATAAAEEASRAIVAKTDCKAQVPTTVCVRQPRRPRVAKKRKRPCELATKALTTSASANAKDLAATVIPDKQIEVNEARYVRDLFGRRDVILWRSAIDEDIVNQDLEAAAMAEYRQAAAWHYQQSNRDQARHWGKEEQRELALQELQWKLHHGLLEISKRPPGDNLGRPTCEVEEDDDHLLPPVPRSSPCESKGKGRFSIMPSLRRASKAQASMGHRRRISLTGIDGASTINEGFESCDGIEEFDDHHHQPKDASKKEVKKIRVSLSGIKPRQPLKARLRVLKRNCREWRQANRVEGVPKESASPGGSPEKKVGFGHKSRNTEGSSSSFSSNSASDEEFEHQKNKHHAFIDLPPSEEMQKLGLSAPAALGKDRRDSEKVKHRQSQIDMFAEWSDKDKSDLRRVFDLHDGNNSDSLDQSELITCLADLGMRGKNETERDEIRKILWAIDKLEVGFYEFATKVVPTIRNRLGVLRLERLAEAFQDADVDGSGRLSIQETLREIRLMGTFPSDEQVKTAIQQVAPHAAENAKSMTGAWLMSRDILDFSSFAALIELLKETSERERREEFQRLTLEFELTTEEKDLFSHNLIDVHNCFARLSGVKPQHCGIKVVTTKVNACTVIRECGLAPRNMTQKFMVSTIVGEEADESGNIDFRALLKVAQRLREHDRQWLHRIFDKYDANRSGGLSLSEVQCALGECGVRPRTQHEASEVQSLVLEFDEDSSGEVDCEEFVELCRFVSEKLHRVQREVERQTAVRFGWSDKHFEELRAAFMALDQDASDTLEFSEMMQAVESFQRTSLREDVNLVLEEAGLPQHSKGSKVDFLSFVKIVKALEDRESQRSTAKKYHFEGEAGNRLRDAFRALNPNEEGMVPRDKVKPLLMEGDDDAAAAAAAEIQRELVGTQPLKIGFEVFAKFMRKKIDAGVARRTSSKSVYHSTNSGARSASKARANS